MAKKGGDPISKGFKRIGKTLKKSIGQPIDKGFKTFGKLIDKNVGKPIKGGFKSMIKGFKSIGGIFKIVIRGFIRVALFVWKIFIWVAMWVMCAFNKILQLPQCFLWYFLEFLGFVFYLPFRILFAIIDLIVPGFNKIIYEGWCFLYRLDSSVYSTTGYHFMHYPDEIINKCYKCGVGQFPKF